MFYHPRSIALCIRVLTFWVIELLLGPLWVMTSTVINNIQQYFYELMARRFAYYPLNLKPLGLNSDLPFVSCFTKGQFTIRSDLAY